MAVLSRSSGDWCHRRFAAQGQAGAPEDRPVIASFYFRFLFLPGCWCLCRQKYLSWAPRSPASPACRHSWWSRWWPSGSRRKISCEHRYPHQTYPAEMVYLSNISLARKNGVIQRDFPCSSPSRRTQGSVDATVSSLPALQLSFVPKRGRSQCCFCPSIGPSGSWSCRTPRRSGNSRGV